MNAIAKIIARAWFLAVVLLAVSPVLASPVEEAALVKEAQPHLDTLFDPSTDVGKKAGAIKELQNILGRMNALVERSPELKKPAAEDDDLNSEFLELQRSLTEELPKAAQKLADETKEDAEKPDAANQTKVETSEVGGACPPLRLPNPNNSANKEIPKLARAVADAYARLQKLIDQPKGTTEQDQAAQISRRDQALRDLAVAQVELVWAYADGPPKDEWGALLDQRAKFQKSLETMRVNDAKVRPLLVDLQELHDQFNKQRHQWSDGGKSVPSYFSLDSQARKIVNQIEALQRDSHAAYLQFLDIIKPTEAAAKAVFAKQLENGLRNLNAQMQREGKTGAPFVLFAPKTGHERLLLDQALGEWVSQRLLILGARTRSGGWTDFKMFVDYDYSTRGPVDCKPELDPEPRGDDSNEDSSNTIEEDIGNLFDDLPMARHDEGCSSDGMVGNLNCGVIAPMSTESAPQ